MASMVSGLEGITEVPRAAVTRGRAKRPRGRPQGSNPDSYGVNFTLRVSEEARAAAQIIASRDRCSEAAVFRRLIDKGMEDELSRTPKGRVHDVIARAIAS